MITDYATSGASTHEITTITILERSSIRIALFNNPQG